ncbi:MAG: holo-ACP synthase [candidate division WOR-3 bacterium]
MRTIFGIGIDLIEVKRIERTFFRFGERFARRIFTESEIKFCEQKKDGKFQSYAARFAAKEAFAKALGTGLRGKISWREIEIIDDERHRPQMVAKGKAKEYLGERTVHLSISHIADYACAICLIEEKNSP